MKLRAVIVLITLVIIALYLWAKPSIKEIADGYFIVHYRGNGGMTYVANEAGIKLVGPTIKELNITKEKISGKAGENGDMPFSIDLVTGDVEFDISTTIKTD